MGCDALQSCSQARRFRTTVKMETVCCSETSVHLCCNAQFYVPRGFNIRVIKSIPHNCVLEVALHPRIQFDIVYLALG
jgi:hypothetical protein